MEWNNMNVIRIVGGLGNQMFQFAFYYAMKQLVSDTKCDVSFYDDNISHNGFELSKIFSVDIDIASERELRNFGFNKYEFFKKNILIRRTLKKYYSSKKVIQNRFEYDSSVFKMRNKYFEGYWQSEKYFLPYRNEIIKLFEFPMIADTKNKRLYEIITCTNSISLHIRRGDYLDPANRIIHGDICTLDYYKRAMEMIEKAVENPFYFVFSDDIEWAKKNILKNNCEYIDYNNGDNSYIDMQLMSLCKHNIIANSSFSWWAAYLNMNCDKIIIAPSKWFNNDLNTNDILPSQWLKVEV